MSRSLLASKPDGERKKNMNAISDWVRQRIYVLHHIPTKYFLPGHDAAFSQLVVELNARGCIHLDKDGEPCVLSGQPPVIAYDEADTA